MLDHRDRKVLSDRKETLESKEMLDHRGRKVILALREVQVYKEKLDHKAKTEFKVHKVI